MHSSTLRSSTGSKAKLQTHAEPATSPPAITSVRRIGILSGAIVLFLLPLFFSSCASYNSLELQRNLGVRLVDSLATKETVLLFRNLKTISDKKIIFGHQNTTQYGVFWRGDSARSDIKDVTGSFPGVYGWDFEVIPRSDRATARDELPRLVEEAYERGGINTFSWHHSNPVTDRSFYDTTIEMKITNANKLVLRQKVFLYF